MWIDEAADRVGLTKTTLYKCRQTGKGTMSFTVGRRATYRVADLDAYIEALYQAARSPEPNPEMRPPEPRRPPLPRGSARRPPSP
ncbi:helix-turn-helix transcriptional regulator [Streptomyces durmitorensis]|uniref:helix-turn-helix transcriptional regulator n=1 Tax=Streptomyces durmitorensis TaxID=319947 RepID=UPI003D300966